MHMLNFFILVTNGDSRDQENLAVIQSKDFKIEQISASKEGVKLKSGCVITL